MAKPNYSFEKRQRELAKKKKKEEKLKEKADRKLHGDAPAADDEAAEAAGEDGEPAAPSAENQSAG
ncbi:hypothetical protein [Piscinibacter gummiphilus]|uniref:Uncharacterized protein n=1 Tax=Piscinibacter gummiphilus TaxID=946333 RepID=A0A1W6LAR0_9BURK|nr:hypothetical protein [Piscinibacter gummiphilus]ARN21381.1 hypothetical protein A4W93_16575 [Piscinibacter gummiphilus]ATU66066.1 hypothetical protein CPZ87_16660 [Piscinibacter gummiphilus]GLS96272.1 hypothetical protein GCM10007918_35640 [Piscinibacter gummiphilus]